MWTSSTSPLLIATLMFTLNPSVSFSQQTSDSSHEEETLQNGVRVISRNTESVRGDYKVVTHSRRKISSNETEYRLDRTIYFKGKEVESLTINEASKNYITVVKPATADAAKKDKLKKYVTSLPDEVELAKTPAGNRVTEHLKRFAQGNEGGAELETCLVKKNGDFRIKAVIRNRQVAGKTPSVTVRPNGKVEVTHQPLVVYDWTTSGEITGNILSGQTEGVVKIGVIELSLLELLMLLAA